MMHRQAMEIIHAIEHGMDITRLTFRGVHVWPLLRQRLWCTLINPHLHNLSLPAEFRRDIRHVLARKSLDVLETLGQRDVLFLSRPQDNRERLQGKHYNPFIDPLVEALGPRHSRVKLEEDTGLGGVEPWCPPVPYSVALGEAGTFPEDPVPGFEEFEDKASGLVPCLPGRDIIVKDALVAASYRRLFGQVLDMLRPRAVFLVCYYHPPFNGLMQACHERGIACVDVQHGKQGENHGAYSHWTVFPQGGWDMLPTHFWLWGEPSRQSIERWLPKERNGIPEALVGGAPWLGLWVEDSASLLTPEVARVQERAGGRVVVLTTLQPAWQDVPEIIVQAMRDSPATWFWLVRAHPGQKDNLHALEKQLEAAGLDNWDLRAASTLPLYALFSASHCHVTAYSSCCLEALHFKLPTVLWGERGAALYKDSISRGTFRHATTARQLVREIGLALDDAPPAAPAELAYMQTSGDVPRKALDSVLRWSESSSINNRRNHS